MLLAENRDKGLHVFFINQVDDPEAKRHRWRQYREVWGFVEGERCRRAAILRHFGDRVEPRWPPGAAVTSATARCRRARGGRPAARAPSPERRATADASSRRSSPSSREAQPSVGRTRAVEILRGGRSKVVRKYGYDELPGYGEFDDWRADDLLREVDALIDARHAALDRRAVSEAPGRRGERLRRAAVLASGAGTNLQAILDRLARREGSRWWRSARTSPRRGRSSARAAPGSRPRSFPVGEHPDREARDLAIADWLDARDVDLVVLAGYMQLLSRGVRAAVRRTGSINVHPALLPSFPGLDAIGQALDHGVRITGVTVHFVDEGVDIGPDHPPAARSGARRIATATTLERGDPRDRARAAARGDPADRRRPGARRRRATRASCA